MIIRNKARLVTQGFNQDDEIDYEETFVLITCLESSRMLLRFACHMNFQLFPIDVKSDF